MRVSVISHTQDIHQLHDERRSSTTLLAGREGYAAAHQKEHRQIPRKSSHTVTTQVSVWGLTYEHVEREHSARTHQV